MFTACQLFGSMKMCKANQLVEKANRLRERPRGLEKAHGVRTRRRARLWKGCRKGGPRHFSKPYVDNGLVFSVLQDNKELLQDLKNYKCTSKNNSPDAKGLVQTLSLWKGLLGLARSGEIHSQPLRTALIKLLSECPEINTSGHSSQVCLYHVRKVGEWPVGMCSQADKCTIRTPARWFEIVGWEYCRKECLGKGKNVGKGQSSTTGKDKCFGKGTSFGKG